MGLSTTVSVAAVLGLAGAVSAQSFSSFTPAEALHDITVNPLGPLAYELVIGPSPMLDLNGVLYPLNSIFGFWALSSDDDISGSTTGFGAWGSNSSNSGTGGILGWKANPNQGLGAGTSQVFAFDAGTQLSTAETFGFHVRLAEGLFPGTTGNTGHVYVVPAPASGAILSLVALAARRRRR